jgi:PAS domain S-box-containing protein
MALALREGRSIRGKEILIERADGTRRHVLPYPEPLRDAAGNLVGAVNMLVDLTERKRAEEALRQSEERLRLALETALDAIVTFDGQGRITGWNPQAEQIFGWSQAEALGKTLSETIIPAEHREAHEQVLRPYLQTGQGAALRERIEMTALDRRGRRFPVEISLTPAVVGEKVYLTAFLRDITERKRAEAVLQESEARLAAASRAKDDFLAVLSHELRTPLNPVLLLASEAAEDESLPAEARARFASIRNNVELEARLIDDLLDLTRIARGKLGLQLGLVDVHAVLQNAIATVRAELDQKHIALVLTLAAGRHRVPGDEVRLQQIIWNLIKNSVKFTPPHGTITVETVSSEDERRICIKITDTGIGMTEEEIERVFHAFSQGDHASGTGLHRFGGMGLGLAISRMLVELHGGGISAHSAGRGKGATFVVDLPLAPAAQARDDRPAAAVNHQPKDADGSRAGGALQFRHILLVEDHEPTRTVLSQLLARRKFKVTTAGSVEEAMAAACEDSIDLLISDIGLPDGNGFDLMTKLREVRGGLKGIALTGYGMEQDIARSRAVGFRAHLTKPVRVQLLEQALAEVARADSTPT